MKTAARQRDASSGRAVENPSHHRGHAIGVSRIDDVVLPTCGGLGLGGRIQDLGAGDVGIGLVAHSVTVVGSDGRTRAVDDDALVVRVAGGGALARLPGAGRRRASATAHSPA